MSIARINMLEFETEDVLNKRVTEYSEQAPELFPDAEILLSIQTSPTSAMSISVYPDEQAAEKALSTREKHFQSARTQHKEAWFLEGTVRQVHVKNSPASK